MQNIRYAYMNHWKNIPYKSIANFREFYYQDKSNTAYYSDWDNLLKYQKALGFDGIEVAPWDLADILPLFGSADAFRQFAKERGVVLRLSGQAVWGVKEYHIKGVGSKVIRQPVKAGAIQGGAGLAVVNVLVGYGVATFLSVSSKRF